MGVRLLSNQSHEMLANWPIFFLDISLPKGAPSQFITLPTPPGSCVLHDIFNIIQQHEKFKHGFFSFFTSQNYLQTLQWSMFIHLCYLTPDFNFQAVCFNRHNKTDHTLDIIPCMWACTMIESI